MTSKEYWKGRSLLLEQLLHDRSEATAQRVSRLYGLAQENIFQQIEKVFSSYVKGGALNEKKAMELLSVRETEEAERELRRQYEEATGPAKRDIWARLSAPAYANRISRLQALRDKLYTQARMMGLEEVSYVRDRLSDTLEQSYYRTTFDLQQFTGEGYRFDRLTDRQITAALATDWSGKNWSERIWDNNQMFADAVEDTVTVGIMAGLRYDEMRDNLLHVIGLDDTEGARYRSARLVHTECAYVANQGHLMGYQAAEIDRYIFLATLDMRTSEICRSLDGKRFLVSEAQPGTNYPPMHPWCRSTTMPDMSAEQLRKVPRAARDPKTGKSITVPGDMTYRKWYEKFVEGRGKDIAKFPQGGIINSGSETMSIQSIDSPIEQRSSGKGNPNAILQIGYPLNERQKRLLDALPEYDSRTVVSKSDVSMKDLAALTAETGTEFAMFTRNGERLIVRGDAVSVNINEEAARGLSRDGYRWSGHTHPGVDELVLMPSEGDKLVLSQFRQEYSVIYNSKGQFYVFGKE